MTFPEETVGKGAPVPEAEQIQGAYPAIEDFEQRVRECAEVPAVFTLEDLTRAVSKQPLHKHTYRKLLAFFNEEHTTEEAEAFLEEVPEFAYAVQPAGRFLEVLERVGGIERLPEEASAETDEGAGAQEAFAHADEVDAEAVAEAVDGDGEEEISPSVSLVGAHWVITDLGREYVEASDPRVPLRSLIAEDPARQDGYLLVLRRCAEEPRTRADLESALKAYQKEMGSAAQVFPSVFLDKLERVGGLYWKEKWSITEEGREILAELTASATA
ncbi:hypothetical protein [uncultured Adlercreutzia sp.]|uniref:hypothetical protein n=1 Tax=uncultured Adlercreutzia sp. TaxID=875803 RepID=UPI0026F3F7A8|nr:hypothetical protein [uncultured Adlercreutzia sp.]